MTGLLLLLACTADPPSPGSPPSPAAPSPAPPSPAPPAPSSPPSGGIIGGEPILHTPVILGALSSAEVERGIAARGERLRGCWSDELPAHPGLAGRVLVSFAIARDGHVTRASVRSTSLRHPPTEDCLVARMTEVQFAPLTDGETARVDYPFQFP